MLVKWLFQYVVSGISFLFLMLTLWHSMLFMWNRDTYLSLVTVNDVFQKNNLSVEGTANDSGNGILVSVGVDILLLCLFILQHSGMASMKMKSMFLGTQFEHLYRSLYIIATAIVLQALLYWWQCIPEICFWNINISDNIATWWLFFLVHAFAWVVLYGGCFLMDFPEMVGLKQVYYRGCAFESPLHLKSHELQTLYQHMRHPSFTTLCLIFWFHPFMTLDRLLLAVTFTFYMVFRFCVDMNDYYYQKQQCDIKLQRLRSRELHHRNQLRIYHFFNSYVGMHALL